MRTYPSTSGPFAEQPYFKPHEIDTICTKALRDTALYPADPEPIRIERFVEKQFSISPTYERLPDGILGLTRFSKNGVEEIKVTTALDDEGTKTAERRIKTTLAHEAGHGLLHAHLFYLGSKPTSLFEGDDDAPQILCRDIAGATSGKRLYDGKWWEVQANMAIGGLLMPSRLVARVLKTHFGPDTLATNLDEVQKEEAAQVSSRIFDVNPIVGRIRINGLSQAKNT